MTMRYKTAAELLTAYYASREEADPAVQAFAWVRAYVFRGFKIGADSWDYAESVLDRAAFDVEDIAQNFLGLDLFLDDLSELDAVAGASVFGSADPMSTSFHTTRAVSRS